MYKKSSAKVWRKYQERYQDKGNATLLTWSTVHAAPSGFEAYTPYIIAIVQFSDKSKATVQLVDCNEADLASGIDCEPVYRKLYSDSSEGIIHYCVKYRPLQKS